MRPITEDEPRQRSLGRRYERDTITPRPIRPGGRCAASRSPRPRAPNAVVCRGVDRVDGGRSARAFSQGRRADIPPLLQTMPLVRPPPANLPRVRLPRGRHRIRHHQQDQDGHGTLPAKPVVKPMPCDCPEDKARTESSRRLQLSRLFRRPAIELLSPRGAGDSRRGNGPRAAHRPPRRLAGIHRPTPCASRLPAGRPPLYPGLAALHAADAPGPGR